MVACTDVNDNGAGRTLLETAKLSSSSGCNPAALKCGEKLASSGKVLTTTLSFCFLFAGDVLRFSAATAAQTTCSLFISPVSTRKSRCAQGCRFEAQSYHTHHQHPDDTPHNHPPAPPHTTIAAATTNARRCCNGWGLNLPQRRTLCCCWQATETPLEAFSWRSTQRSANLVVAAAMARKRPAGGARKERKAKRRRTR